MYIKDLFPQLSNDFRESRLINYQKKVDVVLDTDTFNEIDDQYALVYCLIAPEKINLKAVYAAPFHNEKTTSAGDGMEKSYEEIHRVLAKMNMSGEVDVFRGSDRFMNGEFTPVISDAAKNLVELAHAHDKEEPLYVLAIGALTNIASALLMDPEIIKKITVVWLGAHAIHWHTYKSFNLFGDILSAQIVQGCGVPFVQIPACDVAVQLRTTANELKVIENMGDIGKYLYNIYLDHVGTAMGSSKTIWDLAPVGWLLVPESVDSCIEYPYAFNDNGSYANYVHDHVHRRATYLYRDLIYSDFFDRLERYTSKS